MPTAPLLPAQASTPAIDPANFLIAAADLHGSGQLSAPVPRGKDPLTKAPRKLKVIK